MIAFSCRLSCSRYEDLKLSCLGEGPHTKRPFFIMDGNEILGTIIEAAAEYSKLIGRVFCFESSSFLYQRKYTIYFDAANFLHLTGVKTHLKAKNFMKNV